MKIKRLHATSYVLAFSIFVLICVICEIFKVEMCITLTLNCRLGQGRTSICQSKCRMHLRVLAIKICAYLPCQSKGHMHLPVLAIEICAYLPCQSKGHMHLPVLAIEICAYLPCQSKGHMQLIMCWQLHSLSYLSSLARYSKLKYAWPWHWALEWAKFKCQYASRFFVVHNCTFHDRQMNEWKYAHTSCHHTHHSIGMV